MRERAIERESSWNGGQYQAARRKPLLFQCQRPHAMKIVECEGEHVPAAQFGVYAVRHREVGSFVPEAGKKVPILMPEEATK